MPPRHGKSELCSKYLPAWYLGTFPDRRVIFGSYEADFAAGFGRAARTILDEHGWMFGQKVAKDSSAANRWDVAGRGGGMQTAGVGGPFTGKGAHLLIIDDPVKGYEEAASETWRNKTWEWWLQNVYTRIEPGGAAIVIATRWHEDDLIGRILAQMQEPGQEQWRNVCLPAIAEDGDALGRKPGEALWPARYDEAGLDRIKQTLGSHRFSALYQQKPTPAEGGLFRREWLRIVDAVPTGMKNFVRAWDKGGTEGDGDYTVGVLMGEHEGRFYILDVVRGQWSAGKRDDNIDLTASLDESSYGNNVQIWFEQEPGSGGKQSAEISISRLRGYRVHAEPATGDKVIRAEPLAVQFEAGNVFILKAAWNKLFTDELLVFPNGAHDDQVDAAGLAFRKLAKPRKRVLVGVG